MEIKSDYLGRIGVCGVDGGEIARGSGYFWRTLIELAVELRYNGGTLDFETTIEDFDISCRRNGGTL